MNRADRMQSEKRMRMAIGLLIVFLVVQFGSVVQAANQLSFYQDWAASEEERTVRQARISEGNGAQSVIVYYVKGAGGGQSVFRVGNVRMRSVEPLLWMMMAALLLQILTAFLRPRRRFMRELEQEACDRWSGPLLVRFEHLRDGEKEGGYNFWIRV